MKRRKGDTLIEVAFAIGIFSLVAITVVAVISASTSAAQASLETTLTREDIDSQAEALRFIHDSYVNGIQSAKTGDNKYENLWNAITNDDVTYDNNDNYTGTTTSVKVYNPTTCSEVYNGNSGWVNNPASGKGIPFIINVRKLGEPDVDTSTTIDKIVVKSTGGDVGNKFYPASTYPRILYGNSTAADSEDLYTQVQGSNEINRVEGLYIIAVKGSAKVVTNGSVDTKPAYYDFYIRSCWMPVNSDRASTISTLVRLYDPTIISH